MIKVLAKRPLTHDEVMASVERELKGTFEGSIGWYAENTKLDLEGPWPH